MRTYRSSCTPENKQVPATFPDSESVSPEWLTRCLNDSGIPCQVESFTAKRVGTGQIGKCVRYVLSYGSGPTGPSTLVAKFPSDDPTSRATGVALRNFIKEVRFYQNLQKDLFIRTPQVYFADIVDEGPDFVVLMEDLAPAEQGDQLQGTTPEIAAAAVNELVGLHAPFWCDEKIYELEWLGAQRVDDSAPTIQQLYQAQLPGFVDRYGSSLNADEVRIIEQVGAADAGPLFAPMPDTFSLIHIDYRLDNIMILPRDGGYEITTVDWQSVSVGPPLNDVAYFMGAGLLPAVRRDVEQEIVRGYHQRLLDSGVIGFDWDACWHAYRQGSFAGFGVTVIASMIVERTERGDQMFTAMAERHARHALDLGADEFLL